MCTLKGFTSDAQEEEFSIEPEVGVVIAKTTMPTYIRLILNKYQFRKDKIKKALTVICTILFHALRISNKLQYIPAVSYTVVPLN